MRLRGQLELFLRLRHCQRDCLLRLFKEYWQRQPFQLQLPHLFEQGVQRPSCRVGNLELLACLRFERPISLGIRDGRNVHIVGVLLSISHPTLALHPPKGPSGLGRCHSLLPLVLDLRLLQVCIQANVLRYIL